MKPKPLPAEKLEALVARQKKAKEKATKLTNRLRTAERAIESFAIADAKRKRDHQLIVLGGSVVAVFGDDFSDSDELAGWLLKARQAKSENPASAATASHNGRAFFTERKAARA